MAAKEFKPVLYRYYDGAIYECRLHGSYGDKIETTYFVSGLPFGTTIYQFAPGYKCAYSSNLSSSQDFNHYVSTDLAFWVRLADLKICTTFYVSRVACKAGMKRVFAAMLKEPNADKEYIHTQMAKLEKIKTR